MQYTQIEDFFNRSAGNFETCRINHADIIFEERVKLACYYCDKYSKSWRCPPNIPDIDYAALIKEYEHLLLVYKKFYFYQQTAAAKDPNTSGTGSTNATVTAASTTLTNTAPATATLSATASLNTIAVVSDAKDTNLSEYSQVRRESTLALHKIMLKAERFCWDNNVVPAASFVAGSCRLCKNGCNPERCVNPASARISMEATGINVSKTAENVNLDIIKFPPSDYLVRMGLLCW